jgi:hypothetical protein
MCNMNKKVRVRNSPASDLTDRSPSVRCASLYPDRFHSALRNGIFSAPRLGVLVAMARRVENRIDDARSSCGVASTLPGETTEGCQRDQLRVEKEQNEKGEVKRDVRRTSMTSVTIWFY